MAEGFQVNLSTFWGIDYWCLSNVFWQEFPFLLPVAALGVGRHVGFGDSFDELPFLVCGLWLVPDGFLQLFPPSLLPVLLYQLPLGQPLAVIQHQICCHANIDAFLKATFLALISRDFVYDTFSFIFTGIGWMEIFLNGSSKETLAAFTRDTAVVIPSGFVTTHYTELVLV